MAGGLDGAKEDFNLHIGFNNESFRYGVGYNTLSIQLRSTTIGADMQEHACVVTQSAGEEKRFEISPGEARTLSAKLSQNRRLLENVPSDVVLQLHVAEQRGTIDPAKYDEFMQKFQKKDSATSMSAGQQQQLDEVMKGLGIAPSSASPPIAVPQAVAPATKGPCL